MTKSIAEDISARLRKLPELEQRQVLAYVQTFERRASPAALVRFAGTIAPADLDLMAAAIQSDCERVDASDW